MADGSLTLDLDQLTGSRLAQAAEAAGESPEVYARQLISSVLAEDAETRDRLAEYQRTGETVSIAEGFAELEARLDARFGRA